MEINKNGYCIEDIHPGTQNSEDQIVIVLANPVKVSDSLTFRLTTQRDIFIFPHNETLIHNLVQMAENEMIWYPKAQEFKEEYMRNLSKNERTLVYKHLSFFDEDFVFNSNSNELNNFMKSKAQELKRQHSTKQFLNGFWVETFKGYVESLAEGGDENFWGWLFNRPDFNGLMPYELPSVYEEEYQDFLDYCKILEEDSL